MKNSIDAMLNARSIAVIGASEKNGYSGRLIRNLLQNHYKGTIFPVNPKYERLFERKCYASVRDIPEHVDLAVVVVHASFVVSVVEECEQKQVSSVLIISAGLSETDKINGTKKEEQLKTIAERSGMRIVGPNCLGLATIESNMWACSLSTLGTDTLSFGRAGLISHSGATGFGPLLTHAQDRNVGFKYIITTGNEADLNLVHFIDHMIDDSDIDVIAVLVEGIKDGKAFLEVAEKAKAVNKPIVLLKIGESEVGQRAAANHTASMTGDQDIFNAFVKQYGLLKVDDYDELIECVKVYQNEKMLQGKKLAVVSHSGGIGGIMGDKLGKYSFTIPTFSEGTQAKVDQYLQSFGSGQNPLDLTGYLRSDRLFDIIDTVEKAGEVDGYLFATHGNQDTLNRILEIDRKLAKPVFMVWTGSLYDDTLDCIRDSHIPLFFAPEKAAKNLAAIYKRNEKVERLRSEIDMSRENQHSQVFSGIDLSQFSRGLLNEVESKRILSAFGIPVPKHFVVENAEVPASLPNDFSKNYVMKIVSREITHKTDIGGVKLNIDSPRKFENTLDDFIALKKDNKQIDSLLIEEMSEEGLDLIVGVNQDPQFGPVLMLGLGGVHAELFKQVTWRLLPVGYDDIAEMIGEIHGLHKLLRGFRGSPSYDKNALIELIQKISNMIGEKSEIDSLEINPLRVFPGSDGVQALDGIISLR